jgi:ABC-type Zn uptake system ZnuABC Zn-binding protein ZnuA
LGAVTTEAADPSAGDIARLIDAIRASGVPAIFLETNENDDLMRQIAADAGIVLAPPLYSDALTEGDGPAATYVDLMRANVTTIVTALGGEVPPA